MRRDYLNAILTFIFTVIMGMVIVSIMTLIFEYEPEEKITYMEKGWSVSVDGGKEKTGLSISDIPKLSRSGYKKGTIIVLKTSAPGSVKKYSKPTVRMHYFYSSLVVSLEGNEIASVDTDKYERGAFIGQTDKYIDLSGVRPGDELKMVFTISEDNASPAINVPELGNYLDLQRTYLKRYMYPLFVAIFLLIFGLFFMVVSIILRPVLPEIRGQIVSAGLSIVFGVYILTTNSLSTVMFDTGHTPDLEYICLFLMVPLLYILFYETHIIKRKKVFAAVAGLSTALVVIFMILHFTGTVHMNVVRPPYFILMLIMLVVGMGNDIKVILSKDSDLNRRMQLAGAVMFGVTLLANTLYLIIAESVLHIVPNYYVVGMFGTTGCLAFAHSRLLVYYLYLSETDERRAEFISLTEKVYHDALTGAFNRNSYDDAVKDIDESKEPFGVLRIRIEGLDNIRNVKGHGISDGWLRSFGQAIVVNTRKKGQAFRIGRDSFAVIMRGNNRGDLEHIVENMTRSMRILDYNEPDVPHEISCGIAYSDEQEPSTVDDISELADSRRKKA